MRSVSTLAMVALVGCSGTGLIDAPPFDTTRTDGDADNPGGDPSAGDAFEDDPGTGDPGGGDPEPSDPGEFQEPNDFTATVADFSRDMTIFDGDLARGNNNAAVPLHGTTDAPDDFIIEARAVSVQDGGATTTRWRDIARSESDGAWVGVLDTPMSTSWYRAEVRVKSSSVAAAQTGNRFGVGIVFVIEDQSNTHQGLKPGLDGLVGEEEEIGNEPGDFQFTWCGEGGNTPQPLKAVTDAVPHTSSLAAMAATFAKAKPGLKVMGAFITLSGSSMADILNDSRDRRDWSSALAMADTLTADGSEVGIMWAQHHQGFTNALEQLAGVFWGVDLEGNPLPGVSTDSGFPAVEIGGGWVNHVWPEAFPGLLTGRTQVITVRRGPHNPTTIAEPKNPGTSSLPDYFPDRAQYQFYQRILQQEKDGVDTGVHWRKDNQRGYPEMCRTLAAAMMKATGVHPFTPPAIDIIHWTPDYLELGSSVGPITTRARVEGSTTNFPVDPTADPNTPGQAEALGFMDGYLRNVSRVEIVDDAGNSASAGKLRIYPESGSFDGTSRILWIPNSSGVQLPPGGGQWDWVSRNHCDHLPVVDVGFPNITGIELQPLPDLNTINDANNLPVAESTFRVQSGDPSATTTTNYSSSDEGITFHARYLPVIGQKLRLVQEASNYRALYIRVRADGVLALNGHSGLDIALTNGRVTPGPDGFIDLLMRIRTTAGNERIEAYVNHSAFDPDNELFNNTSLMWDLRAGRKLVLHGSGAGHIVFLRLWRGTGGSGSSPPAGTPWLETRAGPAGAFTSPGGGSYDVYDDGVRR